MGTPTRVRVPFTYGALTVCGAPFQNASARHRIGNSVEGLAPLLSGPTTPNWQRRQAVTPTRFGLIPFRSPLLRESLLLSSPRGTEMFQFPRFPPPALCVQTGVTPNDGCRVSPFGYPRINARSAAPRGFSQPPTSFIGFRRQGIHRWLFVAWKTKMLVLAMQFSRGGPGAPRPTGPRGGARGDERSPHGRRRRGSDRGQAPVSLPQNGTEVPGTSSPAREVETYDRAGALRCRLASDQLGVPPRNGKAVDSLERR